MSDEWISALGRYARRLHASAGTGHHVASPLGAWLLLALAGRACAEPDPQLTEVLGIDPRRAATIAAELLEQPHPAVAAATAVWHGPSADPDGLAGWRAGLPASTGTGPLPDQAGLDRWARDHTFGLIDRFPLGAGPDVVLMLASALATKVSWEHPFEVAPAAALGAGSPWAGRLDRVLRTPEHGHEAFVTRDADAGELIVHAAASADGLRVFSVAAGADVPPETVIAAAYRVAAGAEKVSLFDLPLGEGPLWDLREEREASRSREFHSAVLPCWSATSDLDLTAPGLGFGAASRVLGPLAGTNGEAFDARQSAMARYGRYGFEAAAVTGWATLTMMPPTVVVRRAELRFGHAYAVVAVAAQDGPWDGVPVFSAWVSEPASVSEKDQD
ncbi:hypothetical protein [Actinoplanes rectilineatus]|uniref:hypothetical protein n=1 Tax=Actinoplanes rectilineatus TaxID=113571 RepID=UPI0005F27F85|nr:hypothetical protein [Actinoplanes rectilineatus]